VSVATNTYHIGPCLLKGGYTAPSFIELAARAKQTLEGRRGYSIVCGPITSGGTGEERLNLDIIIASIRGLSRRGIPVFSQLPYEFGIRPLARAWKEGGNDGYCWPILHEFFAPIFQTGAFSHAWFVPGWEGSTGSRWEREELGKLGCTLHDLTHDEVRTFLTMQDHDPDHIEHIMTRLAP
jgi:hypothetical protein